MVAGQRIELGHRHRGKIVTVIIEDTHLRILHGEEEIAVRPRHSLKTGRAMSAAASTIGPMTSVVASCGRRVGRWLGGADPNRRLGAIKSACASDPARVRELLVELQQTAAARLPGGDADTAPPTLVLPIGQAEELFSADAGQDAEALLGLLTYAARQPASESPWVP